MFRLELTGRQKLQAGFVGVILVASGFVFFRNTRAPADMTINSWVEQRSRVGLDPKLPVSAKNPADATKATVVDVFACHDGRLEITEFTAESGLKAQFSFMPDMHRSSYDFYKDPWARVQAIRDPYKHTLTFAAFSAANHQPRRLLSTANLSQAQLDSEKTIRQTMTDEIMLMEEGAKTGSFRPEMYEKVLKALAAYKSKSGDPAKDAVKAGLAHKVMDLAMEYLGGLESDKAVAIDKYVSAMDAILLTGQKAKLGEVSKQLANRPNGRRLRAG